ncbi:hypothetical protein A2U01_0114492, partial [Trifolium medium]|nr:hypothetical protein [Trifolium medium]
MAAIASLAALSLFLK